MADNDAAAREKAAEDARLADMKAALADLRRQQAEKKGK